MRALAFAILITVCAGCHGANSVRDAGSESGFDAGLDAGLPDSGPLPPAPPLGAHFDDGGALNFAVRSTRATRIEAWLYPQAKNSQPALKVELAKLDRRDVWTATVSAADLANANLSEPVLYGYRAWGPNWTFNSNWAPGSDTGFVAEVDGQGNRFNPNKLLIDPYTPELSHDPWWSGMPDGSVYEYRGSNRDKDSGPSAPKSMAMRIGALDFGARPNRAFKDDVVYEVHLKGLTRNDPSAVCPGTYAAAASRAGYLRDLGVTAVELLPVQETPNDDTTETSPGNYWGYSTLAFLAPDRKYACDPSPGGPTREFAAMVKAFHANGLKVFLDVVYNHTSETGANALLSLRGLDNAGYYEVSSDGLGYVDNTGLGGNINAASPLVRDLALDSLKHFSNELGVDGFRFDLAAVLGNKCGSGCFQFDVSDQANILNRAVAELPGIPLIAEPWGIGDGTYQLGGFPKGWSAWNDQFRDSVRTAQNKLGVTPLHMGTLCNDLSGTPNVFATFDRTPAASVNYVVSHDGFTLNDLYACNDKQNSQAWPYGPSPGGTDNNLSWDQGGDAVAQAQAARTGMALAMLSAGVPMMTGGDEFLRTQKCNNNAYNLDSIGNWLDWSQLSGHLDFETFTKRLLAFRAAHPALRPSVFRTGEDHDGNGLPDEAWFQANGAAASSTYLDDPNQHFIGLRLDGAEGGDSAPSIFIAYNQDYLAVDVTLPAPTAGHAWFRTADTSSGIPAEQNFAAAGQELAWSASSYHLDGRSLAVFIEK